MALLGLVADLVRYKDLRREFNSDPDGVATRAGLSDDEKKALFSMNLGLVGAAVLQEILNIDYMFMKGEFPVVGDMFLAELDESTAEYPSPTPAVFRFRPRQARISDGRFELNVYGQSFTRDAEIKLLSKTAGVPDLKVRGHRIFGTYRCSHARAVVTPPPNPGTYELRIQNGTKLQSPPAPVIVGDFTFDP